MTTNSQKAIFAIFSLLAASRTVLLASLLALASHAVLAAKPAGSLRCYKANEPIRCLIDQAQDKLDPIADPDDRADAIGELLYTLAVTGLHSAPLLAEARNLSENKAIKPVKQMDLLYAIDLYANAASLPSDETYTAALSRFATLDTELKGGERVELYANACLIIVWDESMRERWLDFAQSVCTPKALAELKPEGPVFQSLVLAMMPVAMTLAEDRDGFALAADHALSWLDAAEKITRKSKHAADREFVALMGVLMHTMNSQCLDAFDLPDASDAEIERARNILHRLEARVGISGKSTHLRRQVVESLFETGRETEAKKMLRQMLSRVDTDPTGMKIPLMEQVAILLLAARLEHYEQAGRTGVCVPNEEART